MAQQIGNATINNNTMLRKCARAIILNEQNQLLVFERTRQDGPLRKVHHYHSIPGGGMDPGETPEEAVTRELYEEMLVKIVPERVLVHQIDEIARRENFYLLARIIEGQPTFNLQSEEARGNYMFRKSTFKIVWVDVDDPMLEYYEAYGQLASHLKSWLDQGTLPTETVDMRIKSR